MIIMKFTDKEKLEILQQFAQNVRVHRERLGVSQEKLAELSDLHRTYIGSIERSEKIPSLITIVKIAKALKINISQLID